MDQRLKSMRLRYEDFTVFGSDLARPECVWVDGDGVWASDSRGGVALVTRDRPPRLHGGNILEPNGFSRRPDGTFVVADLAENKVFEIDPAGRVTVLLDRIDGSPLGTVNCAWADPAGRVWVSIMTRRGRWHEAFNEPADGHIILIDQAGARIVADGLHLPNEIKVHPDGRHLYGVESLAKRIFRFPIKPNGELGEKEIFGPADLGHGAIPDGFTFDTAGNIWVAIVTRNGIAVIGEDGGLNTIYEEPKMAAVDALVAAMDAKTADLGHVAACAGDRLVLPTSLAFGGPDGRDVFVGSLGLSHLLMFRSPVPGCTKYSGK